MDISEDIFLIISIFVPRHLVANEGNASQTEVCIRLLVAYGARGDMKDNKGQSPIDVFINKNRAAAKMLTTLTCKYIFIKGKLERKLIVIYIVIYLLM